MVYINTTGKHNEVWLDKPYATITVECPDCPSTEDAYNSGWTDGSEDGYHKGYQSGSTDGWSDGYPSGYTDGYGSGYTDGLSACSGGSCEEEWQDGYDSGYTDGTNSVDCTDFYNSGVTDGIAQQKAKLVSTAITENGTYTKEDGFSSVEVNVPTGQTINNQRISIDISRYFKYFPNEQTYSISGNGIPYCVFPDSGYTGIERVCIYTNIDASEAIEEGYNSGYTDGQASVDCQDFYNSGYTSGYTDGLNACSGGNEDLIANLQGDYYLIPYGTTHLRDHAFYQACFSSIAIPDTVVAIGINAFAVNRCLTSITIPDSVQDLGQQAFYRCTNLQTAILGNGLSQLEYGTFQNCYNLTGITIHSGITAIDTAVFSSCSGLTEMTFEGLTPPTLVSISGAFASLGSSAYTFPIYVPCESVEAYKTAFGQYYEPRIMCNSGTSGVSMLDLVYETTEPNQTIRLFHGEAANHNGFFYTFYSGITKMVIDGAEVAKSEENIHHSYPSSADWYFYTFPTAGRHNVKFYVDRSFSAHTDTGWMFPAYELRDQLFGAYSLILPEFPLVEAHIGEGYETIRGGVFQGNTNVTAVTLPSTMVSLYAYPFEYSGIHSIEIPDSVSAITTFQTSGTFNNCASLTSATFGTGITQIGNNTFSACTALTEITFNGVTPPTLLNANSLLTYGTDTFPIYVPASAVSAYQNEPSWADYASRVQAKP